MFSTSTSSAAFSAPTPPTEKLTYEDFKGMVEGHFSYLMQHRVYLKKIVDKKLGETEANEYFKDVLGISIKDSIRTPESCIKDIQYRLDTALALFAELYRINLEPESEKNILKQQYLLEYFITYSGMNAKAIHSKKANDDTRIDACFNENNQIKKLLKTLKPFLPEVYAVTAKCIRIDLRILPSTILPEYHTEIRHQNFEMMFDWDSFSKDYQDSIQRLHKAARLNSIFYRLQDAATIFTSGGPIDKALPEPTNTIIAIKNTVAILGERLDALFLCKKILDDETAAFQKIEDERAIKEAVRKKHLALWPKLAEKIKALEEKYQLIEEKLAKSNLKKLAGSMSEKVPGIAVQIKLLNEVWTFHQHTTFVSLSELEEIEVEFSQKKLALNAEMKEIGEKLEALESDQKKSVTSAISTTAPIRDTAFEEQQQLKIQLWKEEVERKQEEKAIIQKTERKSPPLPVPEEPKVLGKNSAMEKLLNELKPKHLKLLKEILETEKGIKHKIKYRKVCNLIKKHLGGEISEVGNGSSHKRIKLLKYYFEMSSHNQEEEASSSEKEASVATGGMFKQHGGQHNSGLMSPFNLELLVKTIKRTGITLDVVDELLAKVGFKNGH